VFCMKNLPVRQILLKSKIHPATVPVAQPYYDGSVTIGTNLFDRVQRLLSEAPSAPRWKGACLGLLASIGLVLTAVGPQATVAVAAQDQIVEAVNDKTPPDPAQSGSKLLTLGTDDLRTSDFITDIAFSPDGKLIATTAINSPVPTIYLFDVQRGIQVKRIALSGKPGWIQCLVFSPDQSKLAWGEIGGYVGLWDLTMDRLEWREKLHQMQVNEVAFSPQGDVLASCSKDGSAFLQHLKGGTEGDQRLQIGEPEDSNGSRSGAVSLAFTPDGDKLVVGFARVAEISIWQVRDGQLLRRLKQTPGDTAEFANSTLRSVSVTPDCRHIIAGGQHYVPIAQTKIRYGARNVEISEIRVWDLQSGTWVKDLNGEEDHGFGQVALSPDGKRIAVGDFSLLRILNAETGVEENKISLPGSWGSRPEFSPDNKLVAMSIGNTIGLFEVATGRRLHHSELTPEGSVVSADWSPAGDRLVTGHSDGGVRVWETSAGKLVWHQLLAPVISRSGWNARPEFVAFSADGFRIIVAGRRDDPVNCETGIVAIYEPKKGLPVRRIFQREIGQAALSADRKVVVATTSEGTEFVGIEVETGRTLYKTPAEGVPGGFDEICALQFHPTSSTLMLADRNGDVIQFEGLNGSEQRRFVADFRTPEQLQAARPRPPDMWRGVFSADCRLLITSAAEFIYLWDVPTGKLTRKFRHRHAYGCLVAISPDGKTFATSDYGEDPIRLYAVETGEQIMTFEQKDNRTAVLKFSPDGTKLFAGYYRGSAEIWDARR
jgi:WD40 repeat protein